MKSFSSFSIIFLIITLSSCTNNPAPSTPHPATLTTTSIPTITPTLPVRPTITNEPIPYILSEPGSYHTGIRTFTFTDPDRNDREVSISVRYPAIVPQDKIGNEVPDAAPDLSNAPYPVILSAGIDGSLFGPHLVSHGFISVGVKNIATYEPWDNNLIDQPLDILFALDSIGAQTLAGLEGMIDSDNSGVMGYSFDGYNSLAMSGARIDPEFYFEKCDHAADVEPPLSDWRIWYFCDLASKWEQFEAHAGNQITESDDGLWQAMTDPRIRAVMPMAPEGAWLFGERGLAAVDRPTLIIGATMDGLCPYEMEAVYIFEHLGALEHYMISFVGEGHMMIYDSAPIARMKHFATAFFGYNLQGRTDYADYFMEDFIEQHNELAWGVYQE